MAKRLLTEVLTRMPDYEIDLDGFVPYTSQGANSGCAKVPARFPRGPRVLPLDRRPRVPAPSAG